MKKRIACLLMALALTLAGTIAFAHGAKEAPGAMTAAPIKLIFTSVSVPDDAHTKAMYTFKEELEKITNGQIKVEVYAAGQLYTQEAEQDAVKRGDVDLVYAGPNWVAQYVPKWSMFAMPYVFKSYDHMSKYFNSEAAKPLYDEVAKLTGMRPLGAYYLGTREVNLRDIGREVKTPQDMKGIKMRMPNSPTWLYMGTCLGANPTPLSFTEVYMGLKTGTVDGQDNPLPTDKNAKFYEVTKYIVMTDHYINPIMPAINEKKWQSLGPDLQAKVLQASEKARETCDSLNLKQEAELLDFFKAEGMVILKPDKGPWIKFAQDKFLNDKTITKDWDMALFEKLQALAK
ncbi:MAG TPA: sialic acid TRAP transporter substrate-binding protein SiaP [Spirochaetia bacterium]|nr:sialic acid TRAP transporter substrate-binding protein SiaP [Spirochaetia bacterium]